MDGIRNGPKTSSSDPVGLLRRQLDRVGLTSRGMHAALIVLWRGFLLGCALYLALGADQGANLRLNLISYIVALVWSYYDGVIAKCRWSVAAVEGILLHLTAVQVGSLLSILLGMPN